METFTEVQQLAFASLQALAQYQTRLLTQIVHDNSNMTQAILGEASPEKKIVRQADMMKKHYEKTVASYRELLDMASKSSQEASDVLNKRVSASFNEIKTALEKTSDVTAAARHKMAA